MWVLQLNWPEIVDYSFIRFESGNTTRMMKHTEKKNAQRNKKSNTETHLYNSDNSDRTAKVITKMSACVSTFDSLYNFTVSIKNRHTKK